MIKISNSPILVKGQEVFDYFKSLADVLLATDYLAPFEALFILVCYTYLIYYTSLNLLSRNKCYINLSHNMIKWILLGIINCSPPLLDQLFKFTLLTRFAVVALTGAIAYPSRQMQRLHLSLVVRNKDKLIEKEQEDPATANLSFDQKCLNSLAEFLLGLAHLNIKLIHPDCRTPALQTRVIHIFEAVQRKRYFFQLAQARTPMADPLRQIYGNSVNLENSNIMAREPIRQQYTMHDYDSTANSPSKRTGTTPGSGMSPEGRFYECVEVLHITKKRYEYFRDIRIRYNDKTSEIQFRAREPSYIAKVIDDETLELVNPHKNRFVQFKSHYEMQEFIKPIIDESM